MPAPTVSIVVPVWNKTEETVNISIRAFQSIRLFTRNPYELIVVDNASPAHADQKLKNRFTTEIFQHRKARIITKKQNVGFGPAVNIGAREAHGDFLCQMNSDCELVEDSIAILIGVLTYHELTVAMPEHYENCQLYRLGKSDDLMGADWRFGAFWVMPRNSFPGFDERFKMCYYEDTDLWRTIEKSGGKIAGYRGTWVKHVGGASSIPERDEFFNLNKAAYEEKWGKDIRLLQ